MSYEPSESDSDIFSGRVRYVVLPEGRDAYTPGASSSFPIRGVPRRPFPRTRVVINNFVDSELSESSDDETEENATKADAKPYWREPKSILPDGSVTDLLSIHSAEHQLDKAGKQRILLFCPSRPGKENVSGVQTRWLHIHHARPKIETLSEVVMDCSFISLSLRTVALGILDELSQNKMYQRDSGHWERNENSKGSHDNRVIFLSMLHVDLRRRGTKKRAPDAASTLLEFVYYNGVEEDREAEQVVRKMDIGSPSECLHVSTLWCLLLGSGLLITVSHLSLSELCGDVIQVDSRGSQPFYTITVKYGEVTRNVIVEPECSYVDFFRQAIALCTTALAEVADFELRDENYELFTATEWIELMASGTAEDKTLLLIGLSWLTRSSRYHMSGTALRSREAASQRGVYDSKSPGLLEWDHRNLNDEQSYAYAEEAPSPPFSYSSQMFRSGSARDPSPRYIDRDVHGREIVPFSRDVTNIQYRPPTHYRSSGPIILRDKRTTVTVRPPSRERPWRYPEQPRLQIRKYEPTETYIDSEHRQQKLPPTEKHRVGSSVPRLGPIDSYRHGSYDDGIRVYGGPSGNDGVSDYGSPSEDPNEEGNYDQPLHSSANMQATAESVYSSSNSSKTASAVDYLEDLWPSESSDHGGSHRGPRRTATQSTEDRALIFVRHRIRSRTGDRVRIQEEEDEAESVSVPPSNAGSIENGSVEVERGISEAGSLHQTPIEKVRLRQSAARGRPGSRPRPTHRHGSHASSPPARRHSQSTDNSSSNSYIDWDTRRTRRRRRRVNFAKDPENLPHIRVSGQGPNDSNTALQTADALKLPFFMWRFAGSQSNSAMDTTEDVDKGLFRILGKINKSLTRDELGTLYDRTFKCSMEDLLKRHDQLLISQPKEGEEAKEVQRETKETVELKDPELTVDQEIKKDDESLGTIAKEKEEDCPQTNGLSSGETLEETRPELPQQIQALPRNYKHAKDLFDVSKDLLGSFIPIEHSSKIHQVCTRFWGAVDEILRQLSWASTLGLEGQKWQTRDFGIAGGPSFGDCPACATHTIYASAAEGLQHLHTHISCPHSTRPNDDPCFAWLTEVGYPLGQSSVILTYTETFVQDLLEIKILVRQVHSLVTTITRGQQGLTVRPLMPRNLVWAFEELLAAYILTARRSTLVNKLPTCDKRSRSYWQARTDMVTRRALSKLTAARTLLESAKKDILLSGSGRGRLDGIGVDAIGPEFLVAALSGLLQNRPVHGKSDLVQIYHDYLSKLHLQANQRPQRRIFLDVDKLQEELGALYHIVGKQYGLLRWYLEAISPKPWQSWQQWRSNPMVVEKTYTVKQLSHLNDRRKDIDQLEDKAGALKDQVKQRLEILDEGHGKAVRVFTIVTLFFLPLTFVSGFMGMNTSDIRDMESDQILFWEVAIPVTAMVLGLALLYGYKGNDIEDWISRTLRLGHSSKTRMTTSTSTASWGVSVEQVSSRPRLWTLRGRKKAAVRRPTNDSIF